MTGQCFIFSETHTFRPQPFLLPITDLIKRESKGLHWPPSDQGFYFLSEKLLAGIVFQFHMYGFLTGLVRHFADGKLCLPSAWPSTDQTIMFCLRCADSIKDQMQWNTLMKFQMLMHNSSVVTSHASCSEHFATLLPVSVIWDLLYLNELVWCAGVYNFYSSSNHVRNSCKPLT